MAFAVGARATRIEWRCSFDPTPVCIGAVGRIAPLTATVSRPGIVLIVIAVVFPFVVGIEALAFHVVTWDWWPNPITTRMTYDGFDYYCNRSQELPIAPTPGDSHLADTLFGGEIWAPNHGYVPYLWVKFDGKMVRCVNLE